MGNLQVEIILSAHLSDTLIGAARGSRKFASLRRKIPYFVTKHP
jgi:hypothetical protein